MRFTAIALASVFALSSSFAFAHTVRHESRVSTYSVYRDAAPSVGLHPNYGNPSGNFSRDVWGHWGAYYGPMISVGAGGR